MLTCDPKRCVSNADRMALDHLKAAGIIFTPVKRPKAVKPPSKPRIGWKKFGPMRKGFCAQCGGDSCTVPGDWPYGMKLCRDCANVHLHSIRAGLKPNDDVNW